VMMNAPTTFSNVYTSVSQIPYVGWVMAPVAAGAAVALQLAQAATIGSVSYNPAGMAHDGIDNIPKEGTWLLDKGERVLSPRQNKDFTDFMSGQKQAPSAPSEQYNITIQALDGKSVERMLKKNNRHVAGSMKGYARNFGR
ncbi:MAG: lytic transglycosylase domain-containing protein, partial [Acinetobacter sp.]|nr:lytic transglycosylase domain-containing protein [Acinetobacter sp.]